MSDFLKKIVAFSSTQSKVSERINLLRDKLLFIQILEFTTLQENRQELIDIILESDGNNQIKIEIDENSVTGDSNFQEIDFDQAEATIILSYALKTTSELVVLEKENILKVVRDVINTLKIRDIKEINNILSLCTFTCETKVQLNFKNNWTVFEQDKRYFDKNLIILPNLIPIELKKDLSQEFFEGFLDLLAERRIGEEYLIRVGNSKSIRLPDDFSITKSKIKDIDFIIAYIFNDEFRYEDKIQIFRKIVTDNLFEFEVLEISWSKVLQSLKENYSLFIDKKLEDFIALKISLTAQISELTQKIDKSIGEKVEELSKQLLVIMATIISSFIVKLPNNGYQLFLIGAATSYTLILLIIISIKGIHFSTSNFKQSKKDIEKIEQELSNLGTQSDYLMSEFDSNNISEILKKLWMIEKAQITIYFFILVVLVATFIIA